MKPYTLSDLQEIYNLPFTTLIYKAQEAHQTHQVPNGVQLCTLKSIKTGRCPEDCSYCPQSAHYKTAVESEELMNTADILKDAIKAKASGASRFCMGVAWRCVKEGAQFDSVLNTVTEVNKMGLEVCCTLGMLKEEQAVKLKEAGCVVYNHNLDTSRDYYPEIITTRTYDNRLQTIKNVQKAGLEVCSGGILGMGESIDDRLNMLLELVNMTPHPDSVPINALIAVKGTPQENQPFIDSFEFVRMIATTRITIPTTIVRLSAGRTQMNKEMQALCFIAGANSIFLGDKLLTTPNPESSEDYKLMKDLGLEPLNPETARELRKDYKQKKTYCA